MKAVKIVAILLVIYVAIVATFESLLGYFQPAGQGTLLITTVDGDGARHSRVVARIEDSGTLYVAANHWPRTWYYQALAQPQVDVSVEGETTTYRAVPVDGDEYDRVNNSQPLGLVFRTLTGFPPRRLLRLEPE
jgi:hypothetical protein